MNKIPKACTLDFNVWEDENGPQDLEQTIAFNLIWMKGYAAGAEETRKLVVDEHKAVLRIVGRDTK